jgi:hypothetical protein
MAEFLIRKREHFAEATKPAAWTDLKWSGRSLRGDVVEVRENGYWRIEALGTGTHGWNREAFALIQVTNLSLETARPWQGSYSNATEAQPATVQFKNRYRLGVWANVPWVKNMVTVNGVTVEEWYYIRSNTHTSEPTSNSQW